VIADGFDFVYHQRAPGRGRRGRYPPLDVLRNHLGLTGARFGRGLEQRGACMVRRTTADNALPQVFSATPSIR